MCHSAQECREQSDRAVSFADSNRVTFDTATRPDVRPVAAATRPLRRAKSLRQMAFETIEERGLVRVNDAPGGRDLDELDLVDFPRCAVRIRIGGR